MSMPASRHAQRGVTLFVSLILLVLITLMVTTAFTLSNTNLKSVGNKQARDQAIAAANMAIEEVLSSLVTTSSIAKPTAQTIQIDTNNDGNNDYVVSIATPACIRTSIDTSAAISSVSLGTAMSSASSWNTLWEIEATVDDTKTGAKITVRTGARVLLTQIQKTAMCT